MKQSSKPVAVIRDPGEVPLELHTRVSEPISQMTFLQRALLMAELAMIAYNDHDEAKRACEAIGFPDVTFYDRDGSQAFRVRNDHDCVIACRGTEPSEWNDIRADADAASVLAETTGRVHRGFKQEVDDLWPMLESALVDNQQPLWFCGHSLGGAMATICAGRCFLSHIESTPAELYTYGSPRVGNRRYVNFVQLEHFRFVNNNDIVTRAPPAWLGFRHNGKEVYLDRHGKIRQMGLVGKRRDRLRGFLSGLRRWKIDHFDDHSIHRYIDALVSAVDEEAALGGQPANAGASHEGASISQEQADAARETARNIAAIRADGAQNTATSVDSTGTGSPDTIRRDSPKQAGRSEMTDTPGSSTQMSKRPG